MAEKTPICRITVVVIGAKSCGKTSLCTAYSLGYFNETTEYTVSVFSIVKDVKWKEKIIQVEIRDTAGEERFQSVAPIFYRHADAVIVCYDITNKQSFDRIQYWSDNTAIPDQAVLYLVGCKSDLQEERAVTIAMGKEAANTLSSTQVEVKFFETSAKTQQNVQELFDCVISSVMKKRGPELIRTQKKDDQGLTDRDSGQKRSGQSKSFCSKC